jgi:cell division inhibitor SepF
MGFTDSLKKVIGIEEIEDDDIVTEEELEAAKKKLAKSSERKTDVFSKDFSSDSDKKSLPPFSSGSSSLSTPIASSYSGRSGSSERKFSVTKTGSLKLLLIEPKGFNECPKLVESLKAKKPVIINLEKMETETARKIFDFLSGATYALDGSVQKIANNIYIFAPENVNVTQSAGSNTRTEDEPKSPWR